MDFVKNPELAAEPQWAFKIAEWYWTRGDLNRYSDSGDLRTQTRRINGGLNGYTDRLNIYRRALKVLGG